MHLIPIPYLDPGSGSLILQVLIATLLGIGLAVRASWKRIKGYFGRKKSTQEEEDADQQRN
ncbi:MAG: hypothetical protein FJZ87_08880 [Chloroflexi bacterium]|nr:hypothetical protein [Chloroflexota bacterium]